MLADKGALPQSVEGYYLAKLVRRYFGSGSGDGVDSGVEKLFREILVRFEQNGEDTAGADLEKTTVYRWARGKGLAGARNPQRDTAVAVIIEQIGDPDDREFTRRVLLGLEPVPENIVVEYAREIGREKGPTYQYAGNLISSAVRSHLAWIEAPHDSPDFERAKEELDAFKFQFSDGLSIREFADASARVFHRRADPEFQYSTFAYVVGRLIERDDLSLEVVNGRWSGEHAASARALVQAACIMQIVSKGSDAELENVVALKHKLFSQMLSGGQHAALSGFALCALLQTHIHFPARAVITDEDFLRLKKYIERPDHDVLTLRATLAAMSKGAEFHEVLTSRRMVRFFAKNADFSAHLTWRDAGPISLTPLATVPMSEVLRGLYRRYDSWLIRYMLLTFAYRHSVRVPGLETVAEDIIMDAKASDELARDAVCYLAREGSETSRKILLSHILNNGRHRDRVFTALLVCGDMKNLRSLLKEMPAEHSYDRLAALNAFAILLWREGMFRRVRTLMSLPVADRKFIEQKRKMVKQMRHKRVNVKEITDQT